MEKFECCLIILSYDLSGHPKCMLESQIDFENMMTLLYVTVFSELRFLLLEKIITVKVAMMMIVVVVMMVIVLSQVGPKFIKLKGIVLQLSLVVILLHTGNVLLSLGWANLICDVTQTFPGGVDEY